MIIQKRNNKQINTWTRIINVNKTVVIIIFILTVLTVSCHNAKENRIMTANVLYLPGAFDIRSDDNCGYPYSYQLSIDTTINSQSVLDSISALLLEMESLKEPEFSVQVRIRCALVRADGDSLILCLGMTHGTCINKVIMEDNLELSRLIKKHIGYYEHFPVKDQKRIKYWEDKHTNKE